MKEKNWAKTVARDFKWNVFIKLRKRSEIYHLSFKIRNCCDATKIWIFSQLKCEQFLHLSIFLKTISMRFNPQDIAKWSRCISPRWKHYIAIAWSQLKDAHHLMQLQCCCIQHVNKTDCGYGDVVKMLRILLQAPSVMLQWKWDAQKEMECTSAAPPARLERRRKINMEFDWVSVQWVEKHT